MRSGCSVNHGVSVGRPKSVEDWDTDKPGFLCHPMTGMKQEVPLSACSHRMGVWLGGDSWDFTSHLPL